MAGTITRVAPGYFASYDAALPGWTMEDVAVRLILAFTGSMRVKGLARGGLFVRMEAFRSHVFDLRTQPAIPAAGKCNVS